MKTIKFIKTSINVENLNTINDLFPVEKKSTRNPGSFATARKHLIYSGNSCNKMLIKLIGEKIDNGFIYKAKYSVERDADSFLQRLGLMKIQDSFVGYVTDKNGKHKPRIFNSYSDEFITLDLSECKGKLADLLRSVKFIEVLRDGARISTMIYDPQLKMFIPLEDSNGGYRIPVNKMLDYENKGIAVRYYTFMASTSQQRKGCIEMIKYNKQ